MKKHQNRNRLPLLLALAAFNGFDAASTAYVLGNSFGYEVNPLMRWAYGVGPVFFIFVKTVLSGVSICVAWNNWDLKSVRVAILGLVCVYGALVAYQMGFLLWLYNQGLT